MKCAASLRMRKEEMAKIISGEASKPLKLSYSEIDRAIQTFEVAAEESRRISGEFIKIDWTQAGTARKLLLNTFLQE